MNNHLGEYQLQMGKRVPFSEEVAHSIQQQEHLFLSLGAVASVQIMLQRYRSLHCADHVNMPLLYTTRNKLKKRRGRVGKDTKMQLILKAL